MASLYGLLLLFSLCVHHSALGSSRTSLPPLPPAPPRQLLPPAACKLPNKSPRTDVALGFPRIPNRLASTGSPAVAVIAVDFSDAPATLTPAALLATISPAAPALYAALSFGALTTRLALALPATVRMPLPSTAYSFSTFYSHRDYLRNATEAACAAGWRCGAGAWASVAVLGATTGALTYGPAFCAGPGEGYAACGAGSPQFENSVTSGRDLAGWGFKWYNHETGHQMGLVDLYAFDGVGEFRYTGDWSLMGNIAGKGPEFTGWERWLLGWLKDAQVACLGAGQGAPLALAPLTRAAAPGAAKLIVAPTGGAAGSGTTAVCVEYRVAEGYDAAIPKPGLLVYFMDTSLATGEGPVRVLPLNDTDSSKLFATLAVGEALEYAGVRVQHTGVDAAGNALVGVTVAALF